MARQARQRETHGNLSIEISFARCVPGSGQSTGDSVSLVRVGDQNHTGSGIGVLGRQRLGRAIPTTPKGAVHRRISDDISPLPETISREWIYQCHD
jgi:hypothetical protein